VILTPAELVLLTQRTKPAWQRRELEKIKVPYKQRSNGSLIVFWEDVRPAHNAQPRREPQLRLDT
jgi:hypothetical protein